MADEREQQFERALARLLRDASPSSHCPDAETLSAYHERALPPDEMAALKEHITGCVLCQEVLTLVAQSENVQLKEWQNENVPVLAAASAQAAKSAPRSAATPMRSASPGSAEPQSIRRGANWHWLVPLGALAAAVIAWVGVREVRVQRLSKQTSVQTARNLQPEVAPSPSLPPSSGAMSDQGLRQAPQFVPPLDNSTREQKKSPPAPRPAGGLAGSERKENEVSTGLVAETAPTPRSEPTDAPKVSRERSAADSAQNNTAVSNMQGRNMQQALNTPAPAPSAPAHAATAPARAAKASPPPPPPTFQAGAGTGVAGGSAAASMPQDKRELAKQTSEKGRLSGQVTDPSGAVVPGTNVQLFDQNGALVATTSTDSSGNYSVSLPTGEYRLELQQSGFKTNVIDQLNVSPGENRLNGELQVGSTSETVEVTSQASNVETQSSPALRYSANQLVDLAKIAAPDQRYVPAAGGKFLWRLGDAGKIDRSSDHGKTWQPQESGVTADLTAGSASSEKICWVVGKSGTILLTTDSGQHWQQLHSPIKGDLGGIRATSATHAVIWDAASQVTFVTSDVGATWTRMNAQ